MEVTVEPIHKGFAVLVYSRRSGDDPLPQRFKDLIQELKVERNAILTVLIQTQSRDVL